MRSPIPARQRRRSPLTLALVLVAPVLAVTAGASAGAATPAATLEQRAFSDLLAARWTHYVERIKPPTGVSGTVVGGAGPTEGAQTLTLGSERGVEELAPNKTVFIKATAAALRAELNFSVTSAHSFANHWLALKPGTPGYAQAAAGMTMASAVRIFRPGPPLRLQAPATLGTKKVDVIVGQFSGSSGAAKATLDVTTGARPLPLRLVITSANHSSVTVTFSRVGQVEKIAFPAKAELLTLK